MCETTEKSETSETSKTSKTTHIVRSLLHILTINFKMIIRTHVRSVRNICNVTCLLLNYLT
jgi:hypothetical protein